MMQFFIVFLLVLFKKKNAIQCYLPTETKLKQTVLFYLYNDLSAGNFFHKS